MKLYIVYNCSLERTVLHEYSYIYFVLVWFACAGFLLQRNKADSGIRMGIDAFWPFRTWGQILSEKRTTEDCSGGEARAWMPPSLCSAGILGLSFCSLTQEKSFFGTTIPPAKPQYIRGETASLCQCHVVKNSETERASGSTKGQGQLCTCRDSAGINK